MLEELLYRNYLRFETVEDNPERKALQSEIAQAIFDAARGGDYSVLELAGRLAELARGRHLLAWSADPRRTRLWEAFGADGQPAARRHRRRDPGAGRQQARLLRQRGGRGQGREDDDSGG